MWSYEGGQEGKITKEVKETSRGDEYLIILKMMMVSRESVYVYSNLSDCTI